MNIVKRFFLSVKENFLKDKDTTVKLIRLLIIGALTDGKIMYGEINECKSFLVEYALQVEDDDAEFILSIFDDEMKLYQDDETAFNLMKKELIDELIDTDDIVLAEALVRVFKSDGFIQREETQVIRTLGLIKEGKI